MAARVLVESLVHLKGIQGDLNDLCSFEIDSYQMQWKQEHSR